MNTPILATLTDYIKSQSRNKIIFYTNQISGIVPINVGVQISERIYAFRESDRIAMRVSTELIEILNASISHHHAYGRYLSIENLGILFEPELKIDFVRLLDNFSQNNALFVRWVGEMDTDNIYFQTKENGIKINIKDLAYIKI